MFPSRLPGHPLAKSMLPVPGKSGGFPSSHLHASRLSILLLFDQAKESSCVRFSDDHLHSRVFHSGSGLYPGLLAYLVIALLFPEKF